MFFDFIKRLFREKPSAKMTDKFIAYDKQKLKGPIIIGQISEPGPITKAKLQIIKRTNNGETFTLIDNDGEYIKLAKSLKAHIRKLENGVTEITFNPKKL